MGLNWQGGPLLTTQGSSLNGYLASWGTRQRQRRQRLWPVEYCTGGIHRQKKGWDCSMRWWRHQHWQFYWSSLPMLMQCVFNHFNRESASAQLSYWQHLHSTSSTCIHPLPHGWYLSLYVSSAGPCHHSWATSGSHPAVDFEGSDIGHHYHRGHHQVPSKA